MKKTLISVLLIVCYMESFSQLKTIFDVINDSIMTYSQKIYEIEKDTTTYIANSPDYEKKRYNRWKYFFDKRIDSDQKMTGWINSWYEVIRSSIDQNNDGLTWDQIGPFESNMSIPNYIGQVDIIRRDPININTVYLGSCSAGLWKTTDITSSSPIWTWLTPTVPGGIQGMAIHPTNPLIIYIAVGVRIFRSYSPHTPQYNINPEYGLGVFKTINGGTSWSQVLSFQPDQMIRLRDLKMDPFNSQKILAITGNALYTTTDAGASWYTSSLPYGEIYKIEFNPEVPNELVISGDNSEIALSTNGGSTWITSYTDNFREKIMFAATGGYLGSKEFGADAFSAVNPLSATVNFNAITFGPKNNQYIIAVGNGGAIYYTFDSGITWTQSNQGTYNFNSAATFIDKVSNVETGRYIIVGQNGRVYTGIRASYGPPTVYYFDWTLRDLGTTIDFNYVHCYDKNTAYIFGNGGVIYKSTDMGNSWTAQSSGTTNNLMGGYFSDINTGIAVGNLGKVLKTTNGGSSWVAISNIPTTQQLNSVYCAGSATWFAVGNSGVVIKSTDDGNTWNTINIGTSQHLYSVCFYDNFKRGFIGGANGVFHKTVNGGINWNIVALPSIFADKTIKNVYPQTSQLLLTTAYSITEHTFYTASHERSSYCRLFSRNAGSWNLRFCNEIPTYNGYVFNLAISSNNNIYLGNVYFWKLNSNNTTTKYGGTMHHDTRDIMFAADGSDATIFVGNDGGIVQAFFGGYTSKIGNLCLLQFQNVAIGENNLHNVMGGGSDVGNWLRDENNIWQHFNASTSGDGGNCEILSTDNNYRYGLLNGGTWPAYVGFSNSSYSGNPIPYTLTSSLFFPLTSHPSENQTVLGAVSISTGYGQPYGTNMLQKRQGTGSWNPLYTPYGMSYAFAAHKNNPLHFLYASFENWFNHPGFIYHSTDNGLNWADLGTSSDFAPNLVYSTPVSDIEYHSTDPNKFWVLFARFTTGQKIYYTTNGGTNWSNISANLPNWPFTAICYDANNGRLYLGSDFGLWYKDDAETNWHYDSSFPKIIVTDIKINRGTNEMYVSTHARGIWKASLNCTASNGIFSVWSNQTWDATSPAMTHTICDKLVVKENQNLTVSSIIELYDGGSITVEKNATLSLSGSIQKVGGGNWSGTITVNGGGNIILHNGSQIKLASTGKIFIDSDVNGVGTLSYNQGAIINLADDATSLEIKGNLNIQANANFTFTGNGFVKFSSTVTSANNITANAGSSITFTGSNMLTDKVLVIAQDRIFLPSTLASLTIQNGKVEVTHNTGRFYQEYAGGVAADINLNNVKFTNNQTYRTSFVGLYLFDGSNVVVNNVIFEKGACGIYANMAASATRLKIAGASFNNCYTGIQVYGTSATILSSTFTNCYNGHYATAMADTGSVRGCVFTTNTKAVYYIGSNSANLIVDGCQATGNTYGIFSQGGFTLNVRCSQFNGSTSFYGIQLASVCVLNISGSAYGHNDLSNNKYPIYFLSAGTPIMSNGYNKLIHSSGGFDLFGSLSIPGQNISATYNEWKSPNGSPVSGVDYSVTSTTFTDPNYSVYTSCGGGGGNGPMGISGSDPLALNVSNISTTSFNNTSLNTAVTSANTDLENGNIISSLNKLDEILNAKIKNPKLNDEWWLDQAYNYHSTAIGFAVKNNLLNHVQMISLMNKVLVINDKQILKYTNNYDRRLQRTLDKAHTYRLFGKQDLAMGVIENILTLVHPEEFDYIKSWYCANKAEQGYKDGFLTLEEMDASYVDCPCNATNARFINPQNISDENANIEIKNTENSGLENSIEIAPNPVTSTSVISVTIDEKVNNAELVITSIQGKTVKTYRLNNGFSKLEISNKELGSGTYYFTLKVSGLNIITKTIVVID